jgi:hypothetical protein
VSAGGQRPENGFRTLKDGHHDDLGIGGDRMESILWRLDHGALDGASPKVIVLMIGVNSAPLGFANGAPATSAAHGITLCLENLRLRCPQSQIILVKILPAFDPRKEVGKAVVDINTALDALNLGSVRSTGLERYAPRCRRGEQGRRTEGFGIRCSRPPGH